MGDWRRVAGTLLVASAEGEVVTFSLAQFVGLVLLGGGVGYASGLFGVGGGFMVTPLLMALFLIPAEIAVGSSLAQMIAVGAMASRHHAAAGYVDTRLVAVMAPGVLLGTMIGKRALDLLRHTGTVTLLGCDIPAINMVVNSVFVLLLFGIAYRLWHEREDDTGKTLSGALCWPHDPLAIALPASGITRCSGLSLTACGVLLGVCSGLLGIGGGVLLVPVLLYGYGLSVRLAIGTSSALILISAVLGTTIHAIAGHVNLPLVMALLVGSTVGVQLGTRHCHRMQTRHLQRVFALVVLCTATVVLMNVVWPILMQLARSIV